MTTKIVEKIPYEPPIDEQILACLRDILLELEGIKDDTAGILEALSSREEIAE